MHIIYWTDLSFILQSYMYHLINHKFLCNNVFWKKESTPTAGITFDSFDPPKHYAIHKEILECKL